MVLLVDRVEFLASPLLIFIVLSACPMVERANEASIGDLQNTDGRRFKNG